jgi:hypothetical protein
VGGPDSSAIKAAKPQEGTVARSIPSSASWHTDRQAIGATRQEVYFEIFRAFEAQGINSSLPTRVTYTATESAPSSLEVRLAGNPQLPATA